MSHKDVSNSNLTISISSLTICLEQRFFVSEREKSDRWSEWWFRFYLISNSNRAILFVLPVSSTDPYTHNDLSVVSSWNGCGVLTRLFREGVWIMGSNLAFRFLDDA